MPHDSADRGEFLDPVFRKQSLLIELTMTKTGGPASPAAGKHWRRKPTVKKCQKKRALACFQGRWPTLNQSVAWFDFGTISLCTFLRTSPEPFPHCSVVGGGQ